MESTVIGPTVGPRVIGQEAYDRLVREAKATGGNRIGSRIAGPLGGPKAAGRTPPVGNDLVGPAVNDQAGAKQTGDELPLGGIAVAEALERIRRPGADLRAAWLEEHARGNGPRKTILAALSELGVHEEPAEERGEVGDAVAGPVGGAEGE